jgi:hypothetical protein
MEDAKPLLDVLNVLDRLTSYDPMRYKLGLYLVTLSDVVNKHIHPRTTVKYAKEILDEKDYVEWLNTLNLPVDWLKVVANSSRDVSSEALNDFIHELKNPEG